MEVQLLQVDRSEEVVVVVLGGVEHALLAQRLAVVPTGAVCTNVVPVLGAPTPCRKTRWTCWSDTSGSRPRRGPVQHASQ